MSTEGKKRNNEYNCSNEDSNYTGTKPHKPSNGNKLSSHVKIDLLRILQPLVYMVLIPLLHATDLTFIGE